MILSEQEIKEAVGFTTDQMTAYRRIESAVLEKLKAQKPVGVFADVNRLTPEIGTQWEQMLDKSYDGKEYIHLYRHPLPPDDVVRDAERLDWIQANCRCDPMMDGQHKWWPTNFNKCLTGPSIRAAIDAAMKGGAA